MRLSWRDIVTTALAIFGGVIVYAKFFDFNWAIIDNWRNSVAVLAITGLAMFVASGFNFANYSILNITEMVLGLAAIVVAVWGIVAVSAPLFYVLAGVLAALWVVDTARHVYHSVEGESTTLHHLPIH